MYKIKAITIVFLLLGMMIVSGCTETFARNTNSPGSLGHQEKTYAAWYETESIDIDWPY